MRPGEIDDFLQLVFAQQPTGWIIRVGQKDQPGAFVDRRRQFFHWKAPAVLIASFHFDQSCTDGLRQHADLRPAGRFADDFVVFVHELPDGEIIRLGRAGGDQDVVGCEAIDETGLSDYMFAQLRQALKRTVIPVQRQVRVELIQELPELG